ncbi:MAG: alpha,alpha-trehalase [Hydrocarboniphaga sp.]|uniref:alpha,alpha-trehalase TreF n=1 Tax=Hydrocarboniphaga sp. TaxID=2033016 RepID=UPI0026141E7F|nr:alpha,alpha-trehalase TreF [Hydrocarboniphaga sp.]MDB5971679.1 alpha,alpha-trehalase [Hydrocarboniphaga sp.]
MLSPPETGSATQSVAFADTLTPADRYHELFIDVQMHRVFDDSKTFADAVPRSDPRVLLDRYREQCHQPGFDLATFVHEHFDIDTLSDERYVSDPAQSLAQHIDGLWDVLRRVPREHPRQSSLLPLPQAYVVPGGRFTEIYYWDSYFTMLGLTASGRHDLLRGMVDNFAYLIDTYGHVPNGNRSYYLSRSQPPMFVFMVELLATLEPGCMTRYLPVLRREHAHWMEGEQELRPGEDHRHLVCLSDGTLLNRYWDDRDSPREESYREDVSTARTAERKSHDVYRDLRAAAESGWDFSSRWFGSEGGLASTRTTAILPVDLNSFLHRLESTIATLAEQAGDAATAHDFGARAEARKRAIHRLMWNPREQAFFDYDWQLDRIRAPLTAASVAPLFVGIADAAQADALAATIRARLLADGGIRTTETETDEQWDRPNGWAPLQWLAIEGFRCCGNLDLARDIAGRWLATVARLYRSERKLVEKYVIEDGHPGGACGGEYPLQDGFGWSNGVTRRLLLDYPQHEAANCRAGEDP